MSLSYAVRPEWGALPGAVRAAVEARLAAKVVSAVSVTGGFTPAVARVLQLGDGKRVFVKAVGPDHSGIAEMMAVEGRVNEALPPRVPAPAFLCSLAVDGWAVLAFEATAGSHPDLSPGSSDIPYVLAALSILTTTPCPGAVAPANVRFTGWRHSGAWPEHADELARWEERCTMEGDTLVHADLRVDNMLLDGDRLLVVDWAAAVSGAAWVDPAYVCAQLIMAGHRPEQAETLMAGLPAWQEADPTEITAFAVGLCGIWEHGKTREQPPELREYRSRAAVAGRSWISYRLGWK